MRHLKVWIIADRDNARVSSWLKQRTNWALGCFLVLWLSPFILQTWLQLYRISERPVCLWYHRYVLFSLHDGILKSASYLSSQSLLNVCSFETSIPKGSSQLWFFIYIRCFIWNYCNKLSHRNVILNSFIKTLLF